MPQKKPALDSRRPVIKSVDEDKARAFIDGAGEEEKPKSPSPTPRRRRPKKESHAYPWDAPGVNEETVKTYLLRLPEPYMLKLKFIREQTGKSMQRVCLDGVLPQIDAEVKAIIKGG